MTRKDYELAARIIREDISDRDIRRLMAIVFANAFKREDANFNREKFLVRAVGKQDAVAIL